MAALDPQGVQCILSLAFFESCLFSGTSFAVTCFVNLLRVKVREPFSVAPHASKMLQMTNSKNCFPYALDGHSERSLSSTGAGFAPFSSS